MILRFTNGIPVADDEYLRADEKKVRTGYQMICFCQNRVDFMQRVTPDGSLAPFKAECKNCNFWFPVEFMDIINRQIAAGNHFLKLNVCVAAPRAGEKSVFPKLCLQLSKVLNSGSTLPAFRCKYACTSCMIALEDVFCKEEDGIPLVEMKDGVLSFKLWDKISKLGGLPILYQYCVLAAKKPTLADLEKKITLDMKQRGIQESVDIDSEVVETIHKETAAKEKTTTKKKTTTKRSAAAAAPRERSRSPIARKITTIVEKDEDEEEEDGSDNE
jgi:hypothetical protein